MTARTRVTVAVALLLGVLLGLLTIVSAAGSCPVALPTQPCPDALQNRVLVVGLASAAVASVATGFAFLAEFVIRGRIVFRGAWWRAARRGVLVGALLAVLAGLQLGGALSVPIAIFLSLLATAVEWFAIRRVDLP